MASEAPLISALEAYAARGAMRFHMPGHKGSLCAFDVTELPDTGDLYRGCENNPVRQAEALFAKTYGVSGAVFLTGGASQGVLALLASLSAAGGGRGGRVLIDRLCHQSVCHALALTGIEPVWLPRPCRVSDGVALPVDPGAVERELSRQTVEAVFVTSPTYHGVCSDLSALSRVCARHGVPLLADAAHGAHLPFLPDFPPGRDLKLADAAVISAHKTLPALGQAAALLYNDGAPAALRTDRLRARAQMFGTSSPSYPILASLDGARRYLDEGGADAGRMLCGMVGGFHSPLLLRSEPGLPADPLRLTLRCADGRAAAGWLRAHGVEPEACADKTVILIVSLCEQAEALEHLLELLAALEKERPDWILPSNSGVTTVPAPQAAVSARAAFFSPGTVTMALSQAAGRIAAKPFAPYPPGAALLMPGERLTGELAAEFPNITHEFMASTDEGMMDR